MTEDDDHTTKEVTLRKVDDGMSVDEPDELTVHGYEVVDSEEVGCPHDSYRFHAQSEDDTVVGLKAICRTCGRKLYVKIRVDEIEYVQKIHEQDDLLVDKNNNPRQIF